MHVVGTFPGNLLQTVLLCRSGNCTHLFSSLSLVLYSTASSRWRPEIPWVRGTAAWGSKPVRRHGCF